MRLKLIFQKIRFKIKNLLKYVLSPSQKSYQLLKAKRSILKNCPLQGRGQPYIYKSYISVDQAYWFWVRYYKKARRSGLKRVLDFGSFLEREILPQHFIY